MTTSHVPVMAPETAFYLAPCRGGLYFDGTVGDGGHAESILDAGLGRAELIGCDLDPAALSAAAARLSRFGAAARLVRGSYADFPCVGAGSLSGLVLDLGLSTRQLSDPLRGFSFMRDGPLDMRYDPEASRDAADLVNRMPERDLADLIFLYGEERYSRRIASAIVRERRKKPVKKTSELADIVLNAVPRRAGRIHPATRTFQALRIAVNGELSNLETALGRMGEALACGGRAVIISFHSLEDRLVKRAFKSRAGCGEFRILTAKPVRPGFPEKAANPASRSAKLRAAEKV